MVDTFSILEDDDQQIYFLHNELQGLLLQGRW